MSKGHRKQKDKKKHFMFLRAKLWFFFLLLSFLTGNGRNLSAEESKLIIATVNPKQDHFSAYVSYEHKILLLAFVNHSTQRFDCQPNRYFLYRFNTGEIREILAGNLRIDNSFTYVFYTSVLAVGGYSPKTRKQWIEQIQNLLKTFDTSSQTLEKSKLKARLSGFVCWQQAALLHLEKNQEKSFPVLMANLCKERWCTDFFWKDQTHVQLWAYMEPAVIHLIRLNIQNGKFSVLKKQGIHYTEKAQQENAPRKNLVTSRNLSGKSIHLSSGKKNQLTLHWKRQKNKHIQVFLTRTAPNHKVAEGYQKKARVLIAKKKYTEAMQNMKYALWFSHRNDESKLVRLELFAAMEQVDNIFDSVKSDFPSAKQAEVCQKIHQGEVFRKLWKYPKFERQFKRIWYQ